MVQKLVVCSEESVYEGPSGVELARSNASDQKRSKPKAVWGKSGRCRTPTFHLQQPLEHDQIRCPNTVHRQQRSIFVEICAGQCAQWIRTRLLGSRFRCCYLRLFLVWFFSSRSVMGRNRKWVLEDNIQDAVWKTILRGPRPPSVRWEKHRSPSAGANLAKKDAKSKNSVQARQSKAPSPKVVPTQPRTVRQSPQLAPRSCGWRPLSVCWEMPTRPRKKIWNGLCNVCGLKPWFLLS